MRGLVGRVGLRHAVTLTLALGLALVFAPARLSADLYVACLQRQLAALGHAPGPVDGVLGARTKASALALTNARRDLSDLLPITEPRAVHWCRELPWRASPALEPFLPSAAPPLVEVQTGPDARRIAGALRKDLEQVQAFVAVRAAGLRGAARVAMVGGTDPVWLIRALQRADRNLSVGRVDHAGTVRQNCGFGDGFGGTTVANLMILCWPSDTTEARITSTLLPLVAHEYTHVLQAELSGVLTGNNRRADGSRVLGPDWLVEGSAEALMFDFMEGRAGWTAPSFFQMQSPARASRLGLADLRPYGTVADDETYHIAHFAAHLLVARHGHRAMFDYWRRLGQGEDWETAFRATFGIGLSEYEDRFQHLRRDLGAAMTFATRQEG